MSWTQLCWKVGLFLALGNFQNSEGILRNPATDRCLYLGYNPAIRRDDISVFVDECSWTDTEKGIQGNRDQWVEVVPIKNDHNEHKIQKYSTDALLCVQANNTNAIQNGNSTTNGIDTSSITVGDCRSTASVFLFKPLKNLTEAVSGNNSSSDDDVFFTIEQPSGKCITIQPGSQNLILRNCTVKNALQKWIACRHVKACDVEISWSPSRIIFPKDTFNSSSDFQPDQVEVIEVNNGNKKILLEEPLVQNQSLLTQSIENISEKSPVINGDEDSSPTIIINEPIYFIQNCLKISKITEKELLQVVSDFYTKNEVQEALEILNTNRFPYLEIEIDPRSSSGKMSLQLVNKVKQVRSPGADSKVIFASEDLTRVPLTFSKLQANFGGFSAPNQHDAVTTPLPVPMSVIDNKNSNVQQNADQKVQGTCPEVDILNHKIKQHLDTFDKALEDLKSVIQADFLKISNTSTNVNSTGFKENAHKSETKVEKAMKSVDSSDEEDDTEIQNIDLRLGPSKKHPKLVKVDDVKSAMKNI